MLQKKNRLGETALHIASIMGNIEIVNQLLDKKSDINALNNEKEQPLHKAAYSRRKDVCDLLILHGADVNAQRDDGDTPLIIAARLYDLRVSQACEEVCKTLIKAGANIIQNNKKETPYIFILENEALMLELLQSQSKLEEINTIKTSNGNTALHLAVQSGNKKLCKALINHDADISIKNNFGQLPYDIALLETWRLECLGDKLIESLKIQSKKRQYTNPDLLVYKRSIETSERTSQGIQNSQ
ncbi:ankyrin repeat domain-containing protein [Thiotrichales bacterium 19S3-7]|nr:ankyrin repeat domain-containing protein [Thiotrichales bacterium 19S3-7]MCF6803137.1 ankyrin repeat domain-containing protein [Thiotrichales bacterium 19S3-11]